MHGLHYLAHLVHSLCVVSNAGDVKEFGFRQIPEDGNYASHFSGATDTPKADSWEASQTPFSHSRPADAESELIDLGQGESQGSGPEDRAAVNQAIADADHASKHSYHPHLHHRGHEQQHEQDRQQPGVCLSCLISLDASCVSYVPEGMLRRATSVLTTVIAAAKKPCTHVIISHVL